MTELLASRLNLVLLPRPACQPAPHFQRLLGPSNVVSKSFEFGKFPGKPAKPLIEWLDRSRLPFAPSLHFISKIKLAGKFIKPYSRARRRQIASIFNLYTEPGTICTHQDASGDVGQIGAPQRSAVMPRRFCSITKHGTILKHGTMTPVIDWEAPRNRGGRRTQQMDYKLRTNSNILIDVSRAGAWLNPSFNLH